MKKTVDFLKKAGTFYLATCEGVQPRVRPFGAITEYEGRIYICTTNTKECFKQMQLNNKIEVSGVVGNEWIRVCGEVRVDNSEASRIAILEDNPILKDMYSPTDGVFEVMCFTKATATFYSYTSEPNTIVLC